MEHYAGLDVSLEQTSVCLVDAQGQVVREAKVTSEPEALIRFLCGQDLAIARVGLEAGPCRSGFTPDWSLPATMRCCSRPGTSRRPCRR